MSPRTEKQYEVIREERKAQIKKVALEIIYEEGFESSSISKIAKRAGISKGLLYNYYESKEEMIREIILEGFDEFLAFFDPNKDGILTLEEAKYFIDAMFNILESNLKYWRLYFSIMLQPKVMAVIAEDFNNLITPLLNMVNDFFKSLGSDNPQADTRITLALLDGICFHYLMDPNNYPMKEIKERIYKIILPA
jgi:AcrR family transcriptional regulator